MRDFTDFVDSILPDPRPAVFKYLFETMFESICRRFTREAGGNTLMPSPSLHEAKQLLPLNVVTMKKKRYWHFFYTKEYSTYDIHLRNLLIGQPVPEVQIEESKYSSHSSDNTCSWNGNIGGYMNQIIDTAYDKTITCNLGGLLLRKIGYPNFMSVLKERKLDMNHHFIREIKDTEQVLCVIRNVITTLDEAEIKSIKKRGGSINPLVKVCRFILNIADIGGITSSVTKMVIEPGTPLAYDVWELRVDSDSGEITPIMTPGNSGGFINGSKANARIL